MDTTRFTATLLRTSASGFAAMAVSRALERSGGKDGLEGDFDAWQSHFQNLVLELAAALEDGSQQQFAAKVRWGCEAFGARGPQPLMLRDGLGELGAVLRDSLPSDSWGSLAGFLEAATLELDRSPSPADTVVGGDSPFGELVDSYLALVWEGDARRAIDLVADAIRGKQLSVSDALDGVLTLALQKIGLGWHEGTINIAEEHFATQTTSRLLEQILFLAPEPSPNGHSVILTMAEGDAHDLGLRIVSAFFELDGWRSISLGANTPSNDLAQAAERFDADLIVIGATLNTHRVGVAQALKVLKQVRPAQKVLIGGPAFRALGEAAAEIGADGCALDARDALRLGRALLGL
ncbi:MAG: methanogenic corrinoid protein MtbC1 [Planctomycetota bacterium]|jgi:methanogenic corrinoid protein MtbC1